MCALLLSEGSSLAEVGLGAKDQLSHSSAGRLQQSAGDRRPWEQCRALCWHQRQHCHQPHGQCWEGWAVSASRGAQLCWGSVPAAASLSLADPVPSLPQGCGMSGSSWPFRGCRCSLGQGRRQ